MIRSLPRGALPITAGIFAVLTIAGLVAGLPDRRGTDVIAGWAADAREPVPSGEPASSEGKSPAYMLCVTPALVCHASPGREGQPCLCFHPLHGGIAGTRMLSVSGPMAVIAISSASRPMGDFGARTGASAGFVVCASTLEWIRFIA